MKIKNAQIMKFHWKGTLHFQKTSLIEFDDVKKFAGKIFNKFLELKKGNRCSRYISKGAVVAEKKTEQLKLPRKRLFLKKKR